MQRITSPFQGKRLQASAESIIQALEDRAPCRVARLIPSITRVALPGGMTALAIEILSRYVPQAWRTVFRETSERGTRAHESVLL